MGCPTCYDPFFQITSPHVGEHTCGLCLFVAVWSCIGVYAASKHAIEAIGDALRQELMYDDVSVSLIEPGFVDTPILRKVCSTTQSRYMAYRLVSRSQARGSMHMMK